MTGYLEPDLAVARHQGLAIYAGVLWSANSPPEEGVVWRARAGAELDPSHGVPWRLYGALDAEIEADGSADGVRLNGQVGIWLPRVQTRPLRLVLELMSGPSALGQFTTHDTGRVAIGLIWNP